MTELFQEIEASSTLVGLFNGLYTITSPTGEHRTFRIKTVRGGKLEGKRIVELLTGPDNESDYTGFAFLADDGLTIRIWSRFKTDGKMANMARLLEVMGRCGNDCGFGRQGFRIQLSKRCAKCNRTLTDPTSIELGIGPVCRNGGEDAD